MNNGWSGGLVSWTDDDRAYLSVVFSWQLQRAYQQAVWFRAQGYRVAAGGPAVTMNPGFMAEVAETGGECAALDRHNPNATMTSRGCVRRCTFCAVPRLEGDLVELQPWQWEPRPIVCDNNLLACSRRHFDVVVDRLAAMGLTGIDFNQGLDARLLTKYHAERLATLNTRCIRLAWDHTRDEREVMRAFETLISSGFGRRHISIYVLIGYDDTPEDALYRLTTVKSAGAVPFPMRYQPIDAPRRNAYVSPAWTHSELGRFMRYWCRLRYTASVPFEEWR